MSDLHRFQSLKILAHADRLDEVARGKMPYPLDWHIYPSNVCNHSCNWCMFIQNHEQHNFPVQLPRDVLLRAVDDAARTGAVLIHFSGGGEPLLNKHTLEAMRLAQKLALVRPTSRTQQLKVALSTNGSHLTPEVAAEVDYIRVSLNAGTPEQHTRTNHAGQPEHKGDWSKILANIAETVKAKRGDIGLAFVVDHNNWQDIQPFCKVAAELRVDFVHIRPAFFYAGEEDAAVREIMPDALKQCHLARAMYGDKVRIFALTSSFDNYWTPRSYSCCKAVLTGTCLRATGDFAVCQDRTDLTFGSDYKDGASFESVWHGQEHRLLVETIHDGAEGELGKCPRCVWNKRNEIIHEAFGKDSMRLSLV